MPLVFGQAISYSPVLYRERDRWPELHAKMTGTSVQPHALGDETPLWLDEVARRIDDAFWFVGERLERARLDALVVLVSDRGRAFDASNTPQLHVFAGEQIWGDPASLELGETTPHPIAFPCDSTRAAYLAEELAYAGFDVSETRGAFAPAGDPVRGIGQQLIEPLLRIGAHLEPPLIPIHINCSVDPCISGHRMAPLGIAIAQAFERIPGRIGILASGGLSGDPQGYSAGWIDDVLDRWVINRLLTGRAAQLGSLFDLDSLTLRGATREIRLWTAAGAAMEATGARAALDFYFPLHHAATGTAFMHWEDPQCR